MRRRAFALLGIVLLAGCFVPEREAVEFPDDAPGVPSIEAVDGEGLQRAVDAALPGDGVGAQHRVAGSLVLLGRALDLATAAQLRAVEPAPDTPCLNGAGADPCVVHDQSTGLVLQPAVDSVRRSLSLPATLGPGAYVLALLAPTGEAHAQVFFLQGEPGLHCWDLDQDHACTLPAEDVDGDGACTPADCQPPSPLDCTGPDCVLDANLAVNGSVAATAEVSGSDLAYGDAAVSDLDGRVAALEAADVGDLAQIEARLTAIEADFATATALASLDARISVVELAAAATAADLAAADARVSAVEADYATATDLGAVDARVAAVEADYATATDLQALAAEAARELKASTVWAVPGDFATVEAAWAEARTWRVAPGVVLTLQVTGVHAVAGTLELDHPDGHRIEFVGGSLAAGSDVLEFTGTDGLWLARTPLRRLENLTIRGLSIVGSAGVLVSDGGHLTLGEDVFVEDFHDGLRALDGSGIYAEDPVVVTGCSGACVSALYGASVFAPDALLDGCDLGVYAYGNSAIFVTDATVQDVSGRALQASNASMIEASGVTGAAEDHCLYALHDSFIQAADSTCIVDTPGNTSTGRAAYAHHGSYIMASGSGVLESEDAPVASATMGSTVILWSGRTLRGNGDYVVEAVTDSSIRAEDATFDGQYTGRARVTQQSFVNLIDAVDPNGVGDVVDTGSVIRE